MSTITLEQIEADGVRTGPPQRQPDAKGRGRRRAALFGSSHAERGQVVVDLSGVDVIATTGITMLLVADRELKQAGGRMVIAGTRGIVRDVLLRCRLDKVLSLAPAGRGREQRCTNPCRRGAVDRTATGVGEPSDRAMTRASAGREARCIPADVEPAERIPADRRRPERILVVEDDADVVRRALPAAGIGGLPRSTRSRRRAGRRAGEGRAARRDRARRDAARA